MKAVSMIAFHSNKRFNAFKVLTSCTSWERAPGMKAFPVLNLRHSMTSCLSDTERIGQGLCFKMTSSGSDTIGSSNVSIEKQLASSMFGVTS